MWHQRYPCRYLLSSLFVFFVCVYVFFFFIIILFYFLYIYIYLDVDLPSVKFPVLERNCRISACIRPSSVLDVPLRFERCRDASRFKSHAFWYTTELNCRSARRWLVYMCCINGRSEKPWIIASRTCCNSCSWVVTLCSQSLRSVHKSQHTPQNFSRSCVNHRTPFFFLPMCRKYKVWASYHLVLVRPRMK